MTSSEGRLRRTLDLQKFTDNYQSVCSFVAISSACLMFLMFQQQRRSASHTLGAKTYTAIVVLELLSCVKIEGCCN